MEILSQCWYFSARLFRQLLRQPWWIAISLAQPIIWLVMYGQLFRRVVELPGFGQVSYITFLTPGIVVISALYGAGWSGMGVIDEIDRGVLDRFLVAPSNRVAIVGGRLLSGAISTAVQTTFLIVLGLLLGARFPGGVAGVLVLILSAILLAMAIGTLSFSMALTLRRRESVIGASNFVLMPMTFMSPVFMANGAMPDWIQHVGRFNPVTWSVEAARFALVNPVTDWPGVGMRLGWLAAFCAAGIWLSVRAFRAYQRGL